MADCWDCIYVNTQMCEGCKIGYMDGINGWIQFDEPTHFIPKEPQERERRMTRVRMTSNIRFYIPKDLTIPTDLILHVGDVYVEYKRIEGGFRFNILEDDETKAMEIAKQIASKMILEHDESEHGVSWRTVEFKVIDQEERYKVGTVIDWFYRVRDSY